MLVTYIARLFYGGHDSIIGQKSVGTQPMFRNRYVVGVLPAALIFGGIANANPVTLSDPFIQLDNSGINDISFSIGNGIFIGAIVLPAGLAGASTTATMSTTDTTTGTFRQFNLPFGGNTSSPSFYDRTIGDAPGLHGQWTLKFTNGSDITTSIVSLPAGAAQLPSITNLTIGGSPTNPTFNWQAPAGRPVEGYRINLLDQNLVSKTGTFADGVLSRTIRIPQFTVPTSLDGGLTLDPTHRYTIQINALENRDGSTNLSNANVFARSRTYFDFTPASIGGPTFTYLPTIGPNLVYNYNVTNIMTGTTIYVDPAVATGYDFATGAGNPNFRTVVLPENIGDGLYDIYGLNNLGQRILLAKNWVGGALFDFGAVGVDWFEVLGIDVIANIDPANTSAFVTGLSFVSNGDFTGTQTPITTDVAAPEPASIALLVSGFLGLFLIRYRQRSMR